MKKIIEIITKIIIKIHPKYNGWCEMGYNLYILLGKNKYKAWKGAFLLK